MFKLLNFNYVPSQTLWVLPPPLVSGPCGCSALGLGLARQKCSPKSQVNRGGGRGRSPVQRAVDRPRGR